KIERVLSPPWPLHHGFGRRMSEPVARSNYKTRELVFLVECRRNGFDKRNYVFFFDQSLGSDDSLDARVSCRPRAGTRMSCRFGQGPLNLVPIKLNFGQRFSERTLIVGDDP